MQAPPKRLIRQVHRAAELRVSGLSWAQVAQKMRRKIRTIQNWPSLYPEYWKQVVEAARKALADESADEAVSVLRTHLRGTEEKVSQVAAKELIHNKRSLDDAANAVIPSALHQFVDHLEGLSDVEFATLMGDCDLELLRRLPVVPVELETAASEA